MAGMWAAISKAQERTGFEHESLSGHAQAFYVDGYLLCFCGTCAESIDPNIHSWHVEEYTYSDALILDKEAIQCDECGDIIGYIEE